ncbi:17038_t:CDS:10, partial [Entrophospora sp. SA101]
MAGRGVPMMQPQIILLKEGTDASQGRGQLLSNINACLAVVDTIRTTLGPRGMDKLIVDEKGEVTISNDGATIMKLLDIVHPAAKTLVDIARSQDAEVGDGTTSVVIIAGELLKEVKGYIEEGVSPHVIIKGYRKAAQLAINKVKEIAVKVERTNKDDFRDLLLKCAGTAMSSKLIHSHKDFFANMVVDAVLILDQEDLDEKLIGKKRVPAEKDNAEVRIDDVNVSIVDAEWSIIYSKLDSIVNSGAKVVLSKLPIGDLATQYFADRDIFCAGRVPTEDLNRVVSAVGGTIQSTCSDIQEQHLGTCESFEEKQIGGERYNLFKGCPAAKTCTLILRGGAEQFIAEVERSLHDAIMIVKRAIKNNLVVAGGGATEVGLAFLTMFLSRAEILKQGGGKNQSLPIPDEHELLQWQDLYNRLFNLLQGHYVSLFPPFGYGIDDMYVWQFLAAMAVGASIEQQHVLVTERVIETISKANNRFASDKTVHKIANVNLFLNALGLDAS